MVARGDHRPDCFPGNNPRVADEVLEAALGAVRFSLSRYTTAEEIDETIAIVKKL